MTVTTTATMRTPDEALYDGDRPAYVLSRGVTSGVRVGASGILEAPDEEGQVRPVAGVTPLPKVGERVALPTAGEGVWLGAVALSGSHDGRVAARLLVGGEVVERTHPVRQCDAAQVVLGTVDEAVLPFVRAVAVLAADRNRIIEAHEAWRDRFVEAAHEAADEHSLCHEFDDLFEEHGMPRRSRDYEVQVSARVTVTLTLTASSADEAREQVTEEAVYAAMGVYDLDQVEVEDIAVD